MKCDRCDSEATVHEVMVRKGEKVEKHLCEQCAQKEGLASQSHQPINALLTKFVVSTASTAKPGATRTLTCEGCGMSYADFRQHGLLGCPACYAAFERELGPLLERAQEGGSSHSGKTPRRAGATLDRHHVVATLRRQLAEALEAEHYEKAAELRDALRTVGADLSPGAGAGRDSGDHG